MKEQQTTADTTSTPRALPLASGTEERPESGIAPDDFGGCPQCCRWDEYLPLGSEDWVVCYKHRTKFMWAAGGGSWSDSEQQDAKNAAILEHLTAVEPAYPAIPSDLAAALLRLADAACEPDSGKAKPSKEQLAADARQIRRWVQATATTWVQVVHPHNGENPLAKEPDHR